MTYDEFVFAMQKLLNYEQTNTDFLDILPRMIEYAELRIYVDLDFLSTLGSQTATLTANNRNVAMPSTIVVDQSLNIITPFSQTNPDLGTRNPVTRVGIDFLNAVYTGPANPGVPQYYAVIGTPVNTMGVITVGTYNILFGPFPDQAYTAEVIGTVRPSPLSPTNTTTFISVNMPELMIAAAMIWGAGFQQAFGQSSDNPQLAVSWESQYSTLKNITDTEEIRKKAASVSWSPYIPTPQANIQRDRSGAAPA